MSRREAAKEEKRRRIVAASRELFGAQGFDSTTVQAIADAADVAVGTLFLYAADKSELLLLVFEEEMALTLQEARVELEAEGEILPAVARFFGRLLSLHKRDPALSRVYIREFLFHSGAVRARLDEQAAWALELLETRVAAAAEAGEITVADPGVAALHLYALYHSTLSFHLAACLPGRTPDEVLGVLLDSFWIGLRPFSTA